MKYYFILIVSLITLFSNAQLPNIALDVTVGGSGDDSFSTFVKVGNTFYLGGTTNSTDGDISDTGFGSRDAWLMKTDENLNPISDTLYGGNSSDRIFNMHHSNSKLFIGINSLSQENTGNLNAQKKGSHYVVMVCQDMNDNILWQKSYGGDNKDEVYDIDEFSNGDLLLTCISNSDAGFDKSEDNIGIGNDIWLIRIDQNGNIVWENTIGGDLIENWAMSSIDNNDNVYVNITSSSNASGDKTENSYGLSDLWLVKLSDQGNIIWDKTIGGSGSDYFGNIIFHNNYLYLLSKSSSDMNVFKSENSINGTDDIWVIKSDVNGNILHENTIGSSSNDNAGLLMFDGNKLIITGGTSFTANNDQTVNMSDRGIWMLELDTNLNLMHQKGIDAQLFDYGTGTYLLNPSNYLVLANTTSDAGLDKTDPALGGDDVWAMILSDDLGVDEMELFSMLNIYPNPTENLVYISVENQEAIQHVQVLDMQGKEVLSTTQSTINIETFSQGVYLIKVNTKSGNTYTQRIYKK